MASQANKAVAARARRGFSLTEMLVIITLILVLLGLVVAAMRRVQGSAVTNQTRTMLGALQGIIVEYRVQTSLADIDPTRPLPNEPGFFTTLNTSFDANNNQRLARLSIRRLVFGLSQVPACEQMLRNLGPQFYPDANRALSDPNRTYLVLDAWDNAPRYYVHNDPDPNPVPPVTTPRSYSPQLEKYLRPFVVSAGPDGKFGDNQDGETGATASQADDNIYSFKLE